MLYLVEVTAWNPAVPGPVVLRFASSPGYVTRPDCTPANTVYEPRVISPGNFERHLYRSGATGGGSEVAYGLIILNNADGGLDHLIGHGFDGRTLLIRRGEPDAAYPAGFPVLFRGTVEQAEFSWNRVTLRLRDRQAEIAEKPLQNNRYLGTNVAPGGVEGTAEDLKGQPKPRLYGRVSNISPPCVNPWKAVYQVSDATGRPLAIDAVYDKGVRLTRSVARASLAELLAVVPAGGCWDWYRGAEGAFLRLGSPAAGRITCDAAEGAQASDRTAAGIARGILTGPGGLTDADLDAASLAALDAANPAEMGLWRGTEEDSVGRALDEVLSGIGAYWVPDRLGTFRLGRLEAPQGPPLERYEAWRILGPGIERLISSDKGRGVPAWRITVRHSRNYTVQDENELAGVAADRRAWLGSEYRSALAENAALCIAHPLAGEITITSLLLSEQAAQAEAQRLLALRGVRRDLVRLKVHAPEAAAIDLGAVVEVRLPRFGWDGGALFRVIGMVEDFERNRTELELWR
ncbi:MAG: phage tail protein [Rhodospirillales bacterium]|nr:phage tail protein [Rhodospirillales bacterium]